MSEVAHTQKRNPLSNLDEVLKNGRYPRCYHLGKFWWRSVKRFGVGGESNVALPHLTLIGVLTTLSHHRALVWSCVYNVTWLDVIWNEYQQKPRWLLGRRRRCTHDNGVDGVLGSLSSAAACVTHDVPIHYSTTVSDCESHSSNSKQRCRPVHQSNSYSNQSDSNQCSQHK